MILIPTEIDFLLEKLTVFLEMQVKQKSGTEGIRLYLSFSENYNRQFLSIAKNSYGNFGVITPITNPGIISEKTKWHHHMNNK